MLIAGCFLQVRPLLFSHKLTDVHQVLFMCLVAGLGSEKNPGTAAINGVVASIILFYAAVKVSLSSLAYVIGSEIGGTRMRKKVRLSGKPGIINQSSL